MGDRGRLVVPLELRERWNMHAGSPLLMIDTPDGIIVATRDQVKRLLRDQLRGESLVDELIADRRAAAAADDDTS
jgi:bifunctional DNA-binding transcriptional regulator/antitoxin component of YhaV-PrlF toxin-antitoxin module